MSQVPMSFRPRKRSKNGCPQCRQRRIKCDEMLPSCTKCLKAGRRCGYLDYTIDSIEALKKSKTDFNTSGSNVVSDLLARYSSQFKPEKSIYMKRLRRLASKEYELSNKKIRIELIKHFPMYFKYEDLEKAFNNQNVLDLIPQLTKFSTLNTQNIFFPKPLFMIKVFKDIRTLEACFLISCSSLLPQRQDLLPNFLKIQGICLKFLLEDLNNLNDQNIIAILTVSIALDISSYALTEDIGYNQKAKFSRGPILILKEVFDNPSKFPDSYPTLRHYGESLYSFYKFGFKRQGLLCPYNGQ